MRLPVLLAALLTALPAAAQTPLTGTNAPATSAPPLAGTSAQPGTPPAAAPATTPPASSLPSTPAQPTARSTSRTRSGHRLTQAQRFQEANTTHDGKLTLDQARDAHMNAVVRDFDAIDKNHRGYVTQADIRDHRRAVRAARKAAAAKG